MMDLAVTLTKQIGVLLLALGIAWGTYRVVMDAFRETVRDLKRAWAILRGSEAE
ncbi:hypothetical protein [Aquipseudomonas alcaligenes]|uniref:Uncharacterized protein n=1 Tax=Aquipseudomonas alcaligenes TaxID=43263 RepID=A0A1N6X7K4_AQUAC|nr:hypothetical protein [Pseudomonas alcaligenes]SIQ98221.1 hypothetical protein SAMN05878282_1121 [Pseudomonas alcaligenes]